MAAFAILCQFEKQLWIQKEGYQWNQTNPRGRFRNDNSRHEWVVVDLIEDMREQTKRGSRIPPNCSKTWSEGYIVQQQYQEPKF